MTADLAELEDLIEVLDDEDLPAAWARIMREMRNRGHIRSWNNPVADLSETAAARRLGLTLEASVQQGYDGTDDAGLRYQIKGRRLTPENKSRQMGVVRKLDQDEFDFLIAVLFDEDLRLQEMWQFPHKVVAEYGKWVPTLNGYRLLCRGAVLTDERTTRIR